MDNKYLLQYLKSFYNDPFMDQVIDYFKIDLDWYLYDYGKNITRDTESKLAFLYAPEKTSFKEKRKRYTKSLKRLLKRMINVVMGTSNNNLKPIVFTEPHKKVLFLEDVSNLLRIKFAEKNIEIITFGQLLKEGNRNAMALNAFYERYKKLPFNERLKKERYADMSSVFQACKREFQNYNGFFTFVDAFFMQKFLIDVFKSMSLPTFIFLHGLPGIYSNENSRADYLLVYGEAIRRQFIEHGFNPYKVLVTGSIHYQDIPHKKSLRNSIDNILVLTTATIHGQRGGWRWNDFSIDDRSLLLTYVYSVEHVLKAIGVRKARLRPHPINNINWVRRFIDTDFYELDNKDLDASLSESTLVIGPTSTTFLQALMAGVSYLVYEPGSDSCNLNGMPLVPPFDGSDPQLKVAFNEEELSEMIKNHYSNDVGILDKYIVPFNIDNVPI